MDTRRLLRAILTPSALALALVPSLAYAQPQFYRAGDLPTGGFGSHLRFISPDGSVIVGGGTVEGLDSNGNPTSVGQAILYTPGANPAALPLPSGYNSSWVSGMNADGTVLFGGVSDTTAVSDGTRFGVWTGGTFNQLPQYPDRTYTSFSGISGDGTILAGLAYNPSNPQNPQPFLWSAAGGFVDIPNPTNSWFSFQHANADGTQWYGTGPNPDLGNNSQAFRFDTATSSFTFLPDLTDQQSYGSYIQDITPDASVLVGQSTGSTGHSVAVRWVNDQLDELGVLGDPGNSGTYAYGVTSDGKTIVGSAYIYDASTGSQYNRGWIWSEPTGMLRIDQVLESSGVDTGGWTLSEAYSISDDGTIVGGGSNPDGSGEGWVITGLSLAHVTGGNNLVIGAADSNVGGSGDFYSSDSSATLDVNTLLASLGPDTAVRTGARGSNTQRGDLTVAAGIDFHGHGAADLTLRATGDVIINNEIADGVTGDGDTLDLALVADNAVRAPGTQNTLGHVRIAAPITLGGGHLTTSGADFDNTGGPIDTQGGDATFTHTGKMIFGADTSVWNFHVWTESVKLNPGVTVHAHSATFENITALELGAGSVLQADDSLQLSTLASLKLGGGSIRAGSSQVLIPGAFTDQGVIEADVVVPVTTTVTATGALTLGDADSLAGFTADGSIRAGAHTVTLLSDGYAQLGASTTVAGGTLHAPNGLVVGGGRSISGFGAVTGPIAADFGSTIRATGNLELGDPAAVDGFFSDGRLETGAFTVTVADANFAVLGSLTRLGTTTANGNLAAADPAGPGFLIEQGKNLTGRGTVSANLKNHGDAIGASLAHRIIFAPGFTVSGKGSFTNVAFGGTFAPGDSPTITLNTNAAYFGAVEIELGGTTPGSANHNHDQVRDAGTADMLTFGSPILRVLPWNGFVPTLGQQFTVMTWTDGLLGAPATLDVDSYFTSLGLSFDLDIINAAGTGSMVLTVIPEPATAALAALAAATLLPRRRR